VGDDLPAKVVKINMSKVLIVVAAFVAPIAVAAGVAGGAILESPRTLAVALGAAWALAALVGYGFYGGKRTLEAATLLLVVALVVIVAYARPWAGGGAEENVVFQYEASFAYLRSFDNEPIENVTLRFPCPNVENRSPSILVPNWALYYQGENGPSLQMINQMITHLMGNRTSALGILTYGLENTRYGPKISYVLDKLYPSETFVIITSLSTPVSESKIITLSEEKDNLVTSAYSYYNSIENLIKISFWSQLSKRIDNSFVFVENFSRLAENVEPGYWWWLYPT
jgi:hypothetical protein